MRSLILVCFLLPGAVAACQSPRISSLRPVEKLRSEALAAHPPTETGEFYKPDLVELSRLDRGLRFDIRYASSNNFLGTPIYSEARAFLQRPAADALVRVDRKLRTLGYGLLVFDAYRPWFVTKIFWDATPAEAHPYVSDPAKGSRHNRGCAVDLTLFSLKSGKSVSMPTDFDDFSDHAWPEFEGGTIEQRKHRDLLRKVMESEGFSVFPKEWWHFDYQGWEHYPIMNVPFSEIR